MPSLPAQQRGGLCPPWRCPLTVGLHPKELCQPLQWCTYVLKCVLREVEVFGSGSCLENLQVFGTSVQE